MFDGISLWWDLPSGWELFSRGRGRVLIYCAPACRGKGLSGYPDQTGQPSTAPPSKFDPRTLDKLYELIDGGANGDATADNVLSALEAVLIAWRKRAAA